MKDPILVFDCSAIHDGIVVECVTADRSLAREDAHFSSEQSQHVLSSVQQVCAVAHVALNELRGIAFVYGGERFTVSRLGAVTASALAWSQHIPICGFETRQAAKDMITMLQTVEPGVPLVPRYSKEPTVTV